MEWKPNPKNKNLTIRITKSDKILYNNLAWKNHTSVSNWAYQIIKKHKHSYGKAEDIDLLIEGLEIAINCLKFNSNLLEEEIEKTTDILSSKNSEIFLLRLKILKKIIDLEKVKNRIEEKTK